MLPIAGLLFIGYVKMLNLTFASRRVIFFAIRRLRFLYSPRPHKQNFKENNSFLGFNFDGSLPIKFQIHSCKGFIVKMNA